MAAGRPQPTYKRQRYVLAFMRQLRDCVTSIDLQKLVFLHSMKEDLKHYEFVPFLYGPYSFQLVEDVEILRKKGFVLKDRSCLRAVGTCPGGERFSIEPQRGEALIRKAYREYPYFTINSKIVDRIFKGAELECYEQRKNFLKRSESGLFTIGYEGRTVESFLNTLIQNDVRVLIDVRRNPLSRKFGFSKKKLEQITGKIGIQYVHIPELGIENEKRNALETREDYRLLFQEYRRALPDREQQLQEVHSLFNSNSRVALMCFEKDPETCHRHVIKDYMIDAFKIETADGDL